MATRRTARTRRAPIAPARAPHPLTRFDRWAIERTLRTLERRGVRRAQLAQIARLLLIVGFVIAFLVVAGGRW